MITHWLIRYNDLLLLASWSQHSFESGMHYRNIALQMTSEVHLERWKATVFDIFVD